LPVEERWKHIPAELRRANRQLLAQIEGVTKYLAYFAILADTAPPYPPKLDAIPEVTEKRRIRVSGVVEPDATVVVTCGKQPAASSRGDSEGRFTTGPLPLEPGANAFEVHAVDPAGNRSVKTVGFRVTRVSRAPRSVKSVKILGPMPLVAGSSFLVRLEGEDADPTSPNRTVARVKSSKTDPKGFDLELVETAANSGVYVGMARIEAETDTAQPAIGALIHGERVTVSAAADAEQTDSRKYADVVPPSAPAITNPAKEAAFEDTFEAVGGNRLGDWQGLDDEHGAALSIEQEKGNSFLRLTQQRHRSHLGAVARTRQFDWTRYPVLSFDYRFPPAVEQDMMMRLSDQPPWWGLALNDRKPYYPVVGRFHGIRADGKWHRAEINLREAVLAIPRSSSVSKAVQELCFVNWDTPAPLRQDFGSRAGKGAYYDIDNFRALRINTAGETAFSWTSQDANGIAGYRYVLDRNANTTPPADEPAQETSTSFKGLADGHWYFHVRAVDNTGNWGPANHSMVIVDTSPPTATFVSPAREPVDFGTPIRLKVDDHDGSGVNPSSVGLKVDGFEYWMDGAEGSAFSWDPPTGILTFEPLKVKPRALIFADGQRVEVELISLEDNAGYPARTLPRLRYTVRSSLKMVPPDPDGKNGWYVTAPQLSYSAPEGREARYSWAIPSAQDEYFRLGNSINEFRIAEWPEKRKSLKPIREFVKRVRLDRTRPVVRAVRDPDGKVSLLHNDYVVEPGGFEITLFGDADLQEPITSGRIALERPWQWRYRKLRSASSKARSLRIEGLYSTPTPGPKELVVSDVPEGTHVAIWVNDEKVSDGLHVKKKPVSGSFYGVMGFLRVTITCRHPNRSVRLPRVSDKTEKHTSQHIPTEFIYKRKPCASIEYRLGEGEWHAYEGPFDLPQGRKLVVRATDSAGNTFEEELKP